LLQAYCWLPLLQQKTCLQLQQSPQTQCLTSPARLHWLADGGVLRLWLRDQQPLRRLMQRHWQWPTHVLPPLLPSAARR
jgi:hypothetical protein